MELTPQEGRVLGALVEKELTTPQGYPLTDNALLVACNQTTSRDPVVSYDVATVRVAVRSLREQGLLRTVHRTGERSDKHRHELPAALELSHEQVVVLAGLLLRGPQTAAEVRSRSERMHAMTLDDVERVLGELGSRSQPLARRLERQPGRKESRWAQLLAADDAAVPLIPSAVQEVSTADVVREMVAALNAAAAAGDVDAGLRLFAEDAVLQGAGAPERAAGHDELRELLSRFVSRPHAAAWYGTDLTVGDRAGVLWFLLVGELVLTGEDQQRLPYRFSGVLVPGPGGYRLAQLHGSRPS